MKRILLVSVLTVLWVFPCLNMAAASTTNELNETASVQSTEVIIIGTIHGKHLKNPDYTPEILKEMIISLNPDAILNELPLSQWDTEKSCPLKRDHDKYPESWVSHAVASQLDIKQFPFDRADREQHKWEIDYWNRCELSQALTKKWTEQQLEAAPDSFDLKVLRVRSDVCVAQQALNNGGPKQINCEGYDRLIRAKHSLFYEIVPQTIGKYPGYEQVIEYGDSIGNEWRERNEIMANNIVRIAAEYKGNRIVVLTGSEHRYILKNLLQGKEEVVLREYWQTESTH